MKSTLRDLVVEDEAIQWSRNDVTANQLVEPNVKVKNTSFEIPVPLVENATLPNNITLARDRAKSLRRKALHDEDLSKFVVDSMSELQAKGYIEPVPEQHTDEKVQWYLPYFVTSQAKKRIVYDGKAEFMNTCVNDIIMSGSDLLNQLVHVLTRFRMGIYALMSDVTKCFFQIQLPKEQRDLFRLLWFEDDDIEKGKLIPFRFCVHPSIYGNYDSTVIINQF